MEETIIQIEQLQDGTAELDADAICTCGGMGDSCTSSCVA